MSSGSSDFLQKDDFEAIIYVTHADMLQNDEELNLELHSCIKNMLSKRHFTKEHPSFKAQKTLSLDCLGPNLVLTAEMKLKPLILKGFLLNVFVYQLKMNVTLR